MNPTFQTSQSWNRNYLPTGGTEKVYLLIELKGNTEVREERAPMNLAMVLDRSGSMDGSPLQFSKKACQFVVDQMGAIKGIPRCRDWDHGHGVRGRI